MKQDLGFGKTGISTRGRTGSEAQAEGVARLETDELEPELREALRNFRLSVESWSDAAYSRSRPVMEVHGRRIWRLAAGWALGCALVAGAVSGGVHERHVRQEQARIAAAAQLEKHRLAAEEQAREEEELLARVDSEVSREVPSAMEPLAQLMTGDESQ
jgi:uncharacterized protein HemX